MLTLDELNRWLALAVASYHGTVHAALGQTPAGRWAEGVGVSGQPATVVGQTAFLVDFLPVLRRRLTRTGFVVDHVHYFANALKPWVARRDGLGRFVIRRDPRDLSRIWVLDPDGSAYVEVPYRNLARPPVSVWEHRQALARLAERGAGQVDEQALFTMIEQMRNISADAARSTRRVRREAERRSHAPAPPAALTGRGVPPAPPPDAGEAAGQAPWFEQIEQW